MFIINVIMMMMMMMMMIITIVIDMSFNINCGFMLLLE